MKSDLSYSHWWSLLHELESMVSYCALGSLKGWLPQDLTGWVSVGVHFLAFCTVSAYWFLQFSLVYLLCYAQFQALPTDLTVKTGSGGIISSLGVSSHFPSIHQQRKQTAHQHQVDNLSLLVFFFFLGEKKGWQRRWSTAEGWCSWVWKERGKELSRGESRKCRIIAKGVQSSPE